MPVIRYAPTPDTISQEWTGGHEQEPAKKVPKIVMFGKRTVRIVK